MTRIVPATAVALAILGSLIFGPRTAEAADDPYAWKWYEVDKDEQLRINLFIFWRNTCPHCPPALAYAEKMRARHPWLKVRRYELNQYPANVTLYQKMADKVGQPAGQTPGIFFCNQILVGYDSDAQTGKSLEAKLVKCYEHLKKQIDEKKAKAAKEAETSQPAPVQPAPAEPRRVRRAEPFHQSAEC